MGADDKGIINNKEEVITAEYKLHLHCLECARTIKRHITSIEGVHKVDANVEGAKLTVKGVLDPAKILKVLEKKSHRKVELLSPPLPKKEDNKKLDDAIKNKEDVMINKDEIKKKQPEVIKKNVIKVCMHCKDCEEQLKRRLQALEGVYSVKTDMKASTCTVEGVIEAEKLTKFIQRKLHKKAEIDVVVVVPPKVVVEQKKEPPGPKVVEEKKEEEIKKEEKKEEIKKEEKNNIVTNTYVIYRPQGYYHGSSSALGSADFFSDENVNACSVM